MKKHFLHRSAFATVMALVCLSLVAITLADFMTRASMQAKRNTQESHRAQQDQIAIAQSKGQVTMPNEIAQKHE
jgi:type II secretory pathway component PulK